jgi:hypothetical protein
MRSHIESGYIEKIDNEKFAEERFGQGQPAEELVANFNDTVAGIETRFSTPEEDKGPEIGGRQTVDLIASMDGKPVFAVQITTNSDKGAVKKKLEEIQAHPFIRLDQMTRHDQAIPKLLVYLDPTGVSKFTKNPDFAQHPELALQILKSYVNSLKFAAARTQIQSEKAAASKLITIFESEQKKYTH